MKIDLHVHTQKCKQGDSKKRNISPIDFVKKMQLNQVNIAAITNHNKFDLGEYEKITEIDENLVIFPGIELDVKINSEDNRHIIVIVDPSEKIRFYDVFDNDETRDYDEYYLNYEDFIKKIKLFEKSKIIIIPHFLDKDKLRSITISEKEKMSSDLSEYVIILEPSSLKTMGIINAHEELSLVGSDETNWNLYNAEKLPSLKFKIKSFSKFYELANNPTLFIKNQFEKESKIKLTLRKDRSPLVYDCNIELFKDINIIFGEKGSGKTYLLEKSIYPYLKDNGKKAYLHKGSNLEEQYEKLIQNFSDNIEINNELRDELKNDIQYLLNYREKPITNYIEKYFEYKKSNVKNKNAKKIAKMHSTFTSIGFGDYDTIIDDLRKDVKKINEVKQLNKKYRDDKDQNLVELNKALDKLKNEIIENKLFNVKQLFTDNHTSEFLENLKQSISKKTEGQGRPNNIGLKNIIEQRVNRMIYNKNILENLGKIKSEHKQKIGNLPSKGDVNLITEIIVLTPEDKHTNTPFNKKTIVENRNIIEKMINFGIKDFNNINDYFTHDEKDKSVEEFISEVVLKNDRISIDGTSNYDPSTGEKSILSISAILENYEYDYYLFDEIERGLGNKYITDYIIPQLNTIRKMGKTVILTTHNANIAINSLPSQWIYSSYINDEENIYYAGNMYSDKLYGIKNAKEISWVSVAVSHLEGSESMFERRRNIYAI